MLLAGGMIAFTVGETQKGIATSGITDVESWLNMIKECK